MCLRLLLKTSFNVFWMRYTSIYMVTYEYHIYKHIAYVWDIYGHIHYICNMPMFVWHIHATYMLHYFLESVYFLEHVFCTYTRKIKSACWHLSKKKSYFFPIVLRIITKKEKCRMEDSAVWPLSDTRTIKGNSVLWCRKCIQWMRRNTISVLLDVRHQKWCCGPQHLWMHPTTDPTQSSDQCGEKVSSDFTLFSSWMFADKCNCKLQTGELHCFKDHS